MNWLLIKHYKEAEASELLEMFVDLTLLLREEKKKGAVTEQTYRKLHAGKSDPDVHSWMARMVMFEDWLEYQVAARKLEMKGRKLGWLD